MIWNLRFTFNLLKNCFWNDFQTGFCLLICRLSNIISFVDTKGLMIIKRYSALCKWTVWKKSLELSLSLCGSRLQSHYREVPRWEIFMEQELRFVLDLGRLALVKKKRKKICTNYEQLFKTVFSRFHGQKNK